MASVDVVLSKCVINLAADSMWCCARLSGMLRPGGRFAVSNILADVEMDESPVLT
jgi:arsenite methyltransferase